MTYLFYDDICHKPFALFFSSSYGRVRMIQGPGNRPPQMTFCEIRVICVYVVVVADKLGLQYLGRSLITDRRDARLPPQ